MVRQTMILAVVLGSACDLNAIGGTTSDAAGAPADAASGGDGPATDGGANLDAAPDRDAVDIGDAAAASWDFVDEFDLLDDAVWARGTWQLGVTQLQADQVRTTAGELVLDHQRGGAQFIGGEVYTREAFGHGVWRARVAAPPPTASGGSGTVCAFFFYEEGESGVNEIDFEILDGRLVVGTYADWHLSDGYESGAHRDYAWWPQPGSPEAESYDPTQFHDYEIQWRADELTFLVDGAAIFALAGVDAPVPTAPLPVHFNHWTSTSWAEVDYPPPDDPISCRVAGIWGRLDGPGSEDAP